VYADLDFLAPHRSRDPPCSLLAPELRGHSRWASSGSRLMASGSLGLFSSARSLASDTHFAGGLRSPCVAVLLGAVGGDLALPRLHGLRSWLSTRPPSSTSVALPALPKSVTRPLEVRPRPGRLRIMSPRPKHDGWQNPAKGKVMHVTVVGGAPPPVCSHVNRLFRCQAYRHDCPLGTHFVPDCPPLVLASDCALGLPAAIVPE